MATELTSILRNQCPRERVEERISALRGRFIQRAHEDQAALRTAWARRELGAMRDRAHGLAGIAATFGFSDIGTAAFALQKAIDESADEKALAAAVTRLIDLLDLS